MTEDKDYEAIIIGGGPGGLTAAIYACRYKLKTLVIAKSFGGEIVQAPHVENYPGFKMISGMELMDKFKDQAGSFGAEFLEKEVISIKKVDDGYNVVVEGDETYHADAVLMAIGSNRRILGVKGEKEFSGRGVSYCATCDAPFFRDKTVAVIGGGNSAILSVLLLSEYAKKVYLIYRKGKDKIRAEPYRVEIVENNPKCEFIFDTNLTEIYGDSVVKGIKTDKGKTMDIDGVFIEIGFDPNTKMLKELGSEVDDEGYIKVEKDQSTCCPGMFAAGDFTTGTNKFKQALCASAEGAVAAEAMFDYIKKKKMEKKRK